MPKLYTSRFSNKELETGNYTVLGVVRSMPKFPVKYRIEGNIIQIAPPGYLFNVYDRKLFTEPYYKHLDKVGYPLIGALIREYSELGKDVVLCCYEDVRKPNEWCHRLVFAEWWEKKTGQRIEELPDPSQLRGVKKAEAKTANKDDGYEQLSLFSL